MFTYIHDFHIIFLYCGRLSVVHRTRSTSGRNLCYDKGRDWGTEMEETTGALVHLEWNINAGDEEKSPFPYYIDFTRPREPRTINYWIFRALRLY